MLKTYYTIFSIDLEKGVSRVIPNLR